MDFESEDGSVLDVFMYFDGLISIGNIFLNHESHDEDFRVDIVALTKYAIELAKSSLIDESDKELSQLADILDSCSKLLRSSIKKSI